MPGKEKIGFQSRRRITSEGKNAADYETLETVDHVYKVPDMWVGSDKQTKRNVWLFDLTQLMMYYGKTTMPQAVERLILEGLANIDDNIKQTREAGLDPGRVLVKIEGTKIMLVNNGLPVPVDKNKDGLWTPYRIFGIMLTGSNFKEGRHEIGRNGAGAKAMNIFSLKFKITVYDNINHLKYKQEWRNNMKEYSEPIITKYKGAQAITKIRYWIDFERFDYDEDKMHDASDIALYARHLIDLSYNSKIPVVLNSVNYNYSNFFDYAKLYFGDIVYKTERRLMYYIWPDNTKVVKNADGTESAKDAVTEPIIEMMLLDTPDNSKIVSFANHLNTSEHGVHVDRAFKCLDFLVKFVNEQFADKTKDKRTQTKVTIADVKPHVSMYVSVKVKNPSWNGQTKTKLEESNPPIRFPFRKELFAPIKKWELVKRLEYTLAAKDFKKVNKADKVKKRVEDGKGRNAADAGLKDNDCVLILCEGGSAKNYCEKWIDMTPEGRAKYGVFPLKGKCLNFTNATLKQILNNEEYKNLKSYLGLEEGDLEKGPAGRIDYTDEDNFKKLRYKGGIIIMTDADADGIHINDLIICMLQERFPSLLQIQDYVRAWISPYLRAIHGKKTEKFYMESDFEEWKKVTPNWDKWTQEYFKGLGSSDETQVEGDYYTPHYLRLIPDDDAIKSLNLVFDKKYADLRKNWILKYDANKSIAALSKLPYDKIKDGDCRGEIREITITENIHHRHIVFSIADLERSLPKIDGLKEGQRKLIHTANSLWHFMTAKSASYKKVKVGVFVSKTDSETHYRHGPVSLLDTVVKMAQEFVGTNNLPYFTREGLFGTRDMGGKDAANTRYTGITPEKWLSKAYRKEDLSILQYLESEEGDKIEPNCFYPIVPIISINGVSGIGTGTSTFMPNHHPEDVVEALKDRILGKQFKPLIPWYKGFKGAIRIERREIKNDEANDELSEVEEEEFCIDDDDRDKTKVYKKDTRVTLVTEGCFHEKNDVIVITELPVGIWTNKYTAWLSKLIENKEIKNFRNEGTIHHVLIKIEGWNRKRRVTKKREDSKEQKEEKQEEEYEDWEPSLQSLRLIRRFGLTNMNVLDSNNRPLYFRDADEVLDHFYQTRYKKYEERKAAQIALMKSEITKLNERLAYIAAVISQDPKKHLDIMEREKEDIFKDMDKLGLAHWTWEAVGGSEFSITKTKMLEQQIEKKTQELEKYQSLTVAEIWIPELDKFLIEWKKHYKMFTNHQEKDLQKLKNRNVKKTRKR